MLLVLLVCCVVYAMVKYYPLPMLCGGGGTPLQLKKKCKKNLTFAYVSNQN